MGIYIEVCLLSMFFAWITVHGVELGEKKVWLKALFAALPPILLSGLRYCVGQDYISYYIAYQTQHYESFELLYRYLNELGHLLGFDVKWIFLSSAVLIFLLIYLQIYKDSPYISFSIFLLFGLRYFFVCQNLMRQFIGIAILMYSIRYIEKRDLKRFLLCVAIAVGFHTTCLAFVIAYWLCNVKITPKVFFGILVLAATVGRYFLLPLTVRIISYTDYVSYIGSAHDSGVIQWITMAIFLVILLLGLLFPQNNDRFRIYFNLQVITIWFATLSGAVVLIDRIRFTFGLPSIIFIPIVIKGIKNNKMRFLIAIAVIFCCCFYVYRGIAVTDLYESLPYRDVITKQVHRFLLMP